MNEAFKSLLLIAFLLVTIWGIWRVFIALWRFFQPIREIIDAQTEKALRKGHLDGLADIAKKVSSGIEGAVSGSEKEILKRKSAEENKKF